MTAQGTSNLQHHYQTLDADPATGTNYYRLREVDKDGKFNFSSVVYVKLVAGSFFAVFPNPVSGTFHLDINLPAAQHTVMGLYDVNGKLLQEKNLQLSAGNTLLPWNISRLATGIIF